jgi:hypothetical protein
LKFKKREILSNDINNNQIYQDMNDPIKFWEFILSLNDFVLIRFIESLSNYVFGMDGERLGNPRMIYLANRVYSIFYPMCYKPNYTALSLQNKALNLKMNDLQLRFFHEIRLGSYADNLSHNQMTDERLESDMNFTLQTGEHNISVEDIKSKKFLKEKMN